MTSTSTIGVPQQQAEARPVAEVALRNPELINEVWCRKVFRQILQVLELQHAMHLHHPAITPATVGIAPNGEPVLIPAGEAQDEPGEAADVQALGAVIHYAITCETPPAGTLRGRALDGYSDSLITAVDRCMSPDPSQRPQSIDELRNLLGIVSLGPPIVAGGPPLQAHGYDHPYQPRNEGLPISWQRWLMIGAAACVLVAAGAGLVALLHDTVNRDTVVLQLPPGEDGISAPASAPAQAQAPHALPAPTPVAEPVGAPVPAPQPMQAQAPTPAQPRLKSAQPPQPQGAARPVATAPQAAPAPPPPVAAAGQSTTYKLVIEPWGTVYVNGDERGVSPPLKRLTLAPGLHTIRVVNPNFQDYVVKVEAGKSATGRIAHDFNDE